MKKQFDIYQVVTDKIVASLEKGVVPWQRPWERGLSEPINAISKKPYNGVNVFLLWITQMARGYTTPVWMTFNQAKQLGANVRKGEKATMVVFWKPTVREVVTSSGSKEEKKSLILRFYNVFNLEQIENLPEGYTSKFLPKLPGANNVLTPEFVEFVKATGAKITVGRDRACYIPSLDEIWMPSLAAFKKADDFAATELHELAHWTGDKKRLDRELGNRFGNDAYAMEELVAEMTSAFVCAHLNIRGEVDDNCAAYIANWLGILKQDSRAIFTVSSKASQAANYLRSFSEESEPEEQDEVAVAA